MLLVRPDKLRGHRVGGYADVDLFFDGKTAAVFGRNINAYTQFEVPGSVDNLIEAMRAGQGVAMPFGDLILSRPYDALVAGVMEAKHIGRGVVEGVECEHLAFRNADTDWQIWVEVGAKPMPRKMVITSKTIAAAPQYTIRIRTWKPTSRPRPTLSRSFPRRGRRNSGPTRSSTSTNYRRGCRSGGHK